MSRNGVPDQNRGRRADMHHGWERLRLRLQPSDRLRHFVEHPWDGLVIEPDAIEMAEGAASRVGRDLH